MHRALCAIALLAIAACGPVNARVTAEVSIGGSGGYAAMDEIPVEGGELRLVTPTVAPGEATKAIAFPLRHTEVHAQVAGPIVLYTVEQTFENPYVEPIEAVYVFPLGDEAAVSGYEIVIGERTIAGEIATREAARATYEEARAAGHTAALVEQDKPNIFAQRIANIAPRETIKVRLRYTELLDQRDGRYELVFPLVVGPRYLADPPVPYVDEAIVDSTVGFTAEIDAGMPIVGLESTSHDIDVKDVAPTRSRVTLAHDGEIPNRDVVVRWRAASERTMVGVLADRRGDDGTFVLVVEPKESYRTGDVAPREVVVLVDTSGSMDGVPLEQARTLATAILDTLGERDTFNVLAFSDGVDAMSDRPLVADARGKARGREFLAGLRAGGGTELGRGLVASLETPPGADRIRMVYLLSDAFVGNDDVVLDAVRGDLHHNRIYPVGIGSAPNRYLIDRLARVGRGFASYLGITESAAPVAESLVRRSAYPYLTDLAIDWGGLDVEDLTPSPVPDVHAGEALVITGRYRRPGAGTVVVRATTAGRRVEIPVPVSLPTKADLPPVAQLWARRRIEALMLSARAGGPDEATREEVTALGLRHHLVTEFTSLVAVDRTRVVAKGGAARVVEQPAAGPEGVNLGMAVGDAGGSLPPTTSYDHTSGGYRGGGGGGGGGGGIRWGGGGGGDVDLWTLLLALALAPLAWTLRRVRSRAAP